MRWFTLLLLTGCLVEKKEETADVACSGNAPTRAPDTIRVDGVTLSLLGDMVIPDVTIQGKVSGIMAAMVQTDANGQFSFSHMTSGVPTEDELRATRTGFVPTTVYPGARVFEDAFIEIRMLPVGALAQLAAEAQIPADPDLGFALVRVVDCNESPVAGATIEATSGQPYYFEFLKPKTTTTQTDPSGLVIVVNMTDGDNNITGSINGTPLNNNLVRITAGEFVQTLARP